MLYPNPNALLEVPGDEGPRVLLPHLRALERLVTVRARVRARARVRVRVRVRVSISAFWSAW